MDQHVLALLLIYEQLSFMYIPLFFSKVMNPASRSAIQPSLVYSALAMSVFLQSGDTERGSPGRSRALWLRDMAQSSLEQSFNARWIDPTLAQAAWILALFEVSAHPDNTVARARSAIIMLDNIIRALALTSIDAADPAASVYAPRAVPTAALLGPQAQTSPITPATTSACTCAALSLGQNWSLSSKYTPLWGHTTAWAADWDEKEIHKEESRRLVWSTLSLATAHNSHDVAFSEVPLDFHVIQPHNYALLFPGESLANTIQFNHVATRPGVRLKDTVWALNNRSMLLWNSCLRMRSDPATPDEKARFAVQAWNEAFTIEAALNSHTCATERAFMFHGRENLFLTRNAVVWDFGRYLLPDEHSRYVEMQRKKCQEYLAHCSALAKRLMQGFHTVTGQEQNLLARRPFMVWWLHGQISRCLYAYRMDPSLVMALDCAVSYCAPIDYLSALYPCAGQRNRWQRLHQRLSHARLTAGLAPPPPIRLLELSPSSSIVLV
ncbi:hypothetical protein BKA62DRAFT_685456 [Auriculariales sp. MPI-PUGE-AT-0066]|nr:hypothetical protein BKA62DRAFT_685456 [Auriculariales sp. MPI-PUGE-AT-0066]